MNNLEGNVPFIAGGASGIGLGMAKAFVAANMKVIKTDIRQDHLEDAPISIDGDTANLHYIQLDVTDRKAMEEGDINRNTYAFLSMPWHHVMRHLIIWIIYT